MVGGDPVVPRVRKLRGVARPAVTTTGAKQTAVTRTEGARVSLDVSAIVRAWAPTAAGGSAATQTGDRPVLRG